MFSNGNLVQPPLGFNLLFQGKVSRQIMIQFVTLLAVEFIRATNDV